MLTEKSGREVLCITGFDNWKKAHKTFSQHQRSVSHREVVMKNEMMQQSSVRTMLSTRVRSEQELNRKML